MKLKLLVGSMVMMGLVSTYVHADTITPQLTGDTTTVMSAGLLSFWEGIVDRNEDNANGVVLNQQNHISGAVSTQAGYTSKRGSTTTTTSPYTDTSPNNKGNTAISLANAELYVDSEVTNWARAHVATSYGSDFTTSVSNYGTTDMFFTEAYAELNNFQQGAPVWMFAKIGRQYLNFGSIQHNTITEPLTDDLALSNATAITVGAIAKNGLYGNFYGYNGSPYGTGNTYSSPAVTDSSNTIHGWGAEVGYAMGNATQGLNVYADYIANITDTLSFADNIGYYAKGSTTWTSIYPDKKRPGFALHANYNKGPFGVIADYVGMVSAFDQDIYSYNGQGANLSAYALEADYTLSTQQAQMISLGYQGSGNAVQFYGLGNTFSMPKSRVIAGYKYTFTSNVNMKFEYMYDKDYVKSDVATSGTGTTSSTISSFPGSDGSNNTVLARLNVMF
ncbi:MAG: LbtU family siderophore porin [Gammaproteobacteria bacterium]|nr:LbtU family siderophore porin [Gammaproteobacteria bacterium]